MSRQRLSRWLLVSWVLVLALLTAGTVALGWLEHRHDQTVAARQAAVAAVAERMSDVLSYDFRTVEADLARAGANLTGRFEKRFGRFAARRVAPAARRERVVTRAEVTSAGVVRAEPDTVVTLLLVHRTTRSATLTDPKIGSARLLVTLRQVDGEWLISRLTPI